MTSCVLLCRLIDIDIAFLGVTEEVPNRGPDFLLLLDDTTNLLFNLNFKRSNSLSFALFPRF